MYRLFFKVPKGLEPVAHIFKQVCDRLCLYNSSVCIAAHLCQILSALHTMQHVTDEGMALVKQAEDAASNKKVSYVMVK